MPCRSLMLRARYHHWANAQLNDFLLECERDGAFDGHPDIMEKVQDALCHTMAIDCLWLDRLEGASHPCDSERRFAVLDLPELLKARLMLDARLMAAVQRLGPAASDETVESSNGLRVSLPSVVRFMLARNQRQRSRIAALLTELNMTPPLMGVWLFESRAQHDVVRPVVSPAVDSRLLAAVG
jgi:uncharacterized damage-inducible protein DinB